MEEIQSAVVIVRVVAASAGGECVQPCWQDFYTVAAIMFALALAAEGIQ
ncbi:hypothetical protein WME94_01410 [Sorangium sp. So ce429]